MYTPLHELQYTAYTNMQYLLYKLDLSDAAISKSPADFLTHGSLMDLLSKRLADGNH